jgi:hypothetical protein
MDAVGDAELTFNPSSEDLYGGSSQVPLDSVVTRLDPKFKIKLKYQPSYIYTLYGGAKVTKIPGSPDGTIEALKNSLGESVLNPETGIESVSLKAGNQENLKVGRYLVEAAGATTVHVYALTNLNFLTRGQQIGFKDDRQRITQDPLSILQGVKTEVPGTGVELTGGSGVINMVPGDMAYFEVTPPHGGIDEFEFGSSLNFPEHGMYIYAAERESGRMFEIHLHRVKCISGLPIPMPEQGYHETDIELKVLRNDNPLDGSGIPKFATARLIKPIE